MPMKFDVVLTLSIDAEPGLLTAGNSYTTIAEVKAEVDEFLDEHGTPDRGRQSVTLTMVCVEECPVTNMHCTAFPRCPREGTCRIVADTKPI